MQIKEIVLCNFRIYKGVNKIDLSTSDGKNLVIVGGDNGFGKTTFLMSLVWCLYGPQMDKVDDLYRKEIKEKGGYGKYIGNSLNFEAAKEGQTRFYVSVTFSGVDIPDTPCTDVTIVRCYDRAVGRGDELKILIDGKRSGLFSGSDEERAKEEEIFIRDYILPIEIAKFFFFDAEKIVSFAQINTLEQRRDLSLAYSQVLGIKKYDDLRNELEKIQDKYRQNAVSTKERQDFNNLIASINNKELEAQNAEAQMSEVESGLAAMERREVELVERLVREGNAISKEEMDKLQGRRDALASERQKSKEGLGELYNLIPFGIAGSLLRQVVEQQREEAEFRKEGTSMEEVEERTDKILTDIDEAKRKFTEVIPVRVRNFYEEQIKNLVKKYFFKEIDETRFDNFSAIHNFTPAQEVELGSLVARVRSCRSDFDKLLNCHEKATSEFFSIEKRIREAEKNAASDVVMDIRRKLGEERADISKAHGQIAELRQRREALAQGIKADRQKKEALSKKIAVSDENKEVDDEAARLIRIIQSFLARFKDEKRHSLGERLEEKLKLYLHKAGLVERVVVDMSDNGDDIDICLLDAEGRPIDKSILSMGEKQMFASALLGALVDETGIDFPVFIDSPMQKFDVSHSHNVLTQFYPGVSKQVVLFPLLNKELTEREYGLILPNVCRTYMIENESGGSRFLEVAPDNLFATYNARRDAN